MNEHQVLIIDLLTEFVLDAQDWNKPYRKKAANAAIEWVKSQTMPLPEPPKEGE